MAEKWILPAATVLTLVAVVVLLAGANSPPLTPDNTQPTVEERVGAVENRLGTAEQNQQYLVQELQKINQQMPGLVTQESLSEEFVSVRDHIGDLEYRLNENDRLVDQHGKILDAISTQTPDGARVPALLSNMDKSPEFAQEMRQAVGRTLTAPSTVRITNRTSTARQVFVNEVDRGYINPSETREFEVAAGNVSTRIAGQDLVNWTLGPPSYQMSLDIVNRDRVVTYYYAPSPPVYVYP